MSNVFEVKKDIYFTGVVDKDLEVFDIIMETEFGTKMCIRDRSNIDSNVEFENAMYLAKKRYERIKNEDKRKIYQKLSQHLAYKGFGYDTIKSVLNKILNFDEYEY